ncbi:AAA family ATPase, partial [Marivirga sp.]|uniref:AAA family ATPase n=1 Tax=Marivirga sp. TaxID=2018662 RepID=UPI0025CBCEC2
DTFYQHDIKYKGSSSKHLEKIENVLKNQPIPSISIKKLSERYDKIYKNEIQKIETKIPTLAYRLIRKKEEEIQLLMQEVIVGNSEVDIAKMIEKFNSKSWVEDGIQFLDQGLDKQKCPFCQEDTISQELLTKFSQYFDKEYKTKIESLSNLKENYIKLYNRYLEIFTDLKTEFNEDNLVSETINELKIYFERNTRKIENKIKDSSRKIILQSLFDFKERIVEINRRIFENNEAFKNIGNIKDKLTQDIWYYLSLKSTKKIESYREFELRINSDLSVISELKESAFSRIEESKKLIEDWRNETVSTNDAVDKINDILRNCGFTGFKIETTEEENGITNYFLKRNSNKDTEIFKTLSEGEKNFIAFLYFYQLCLGTDKIQDSEKLKIIVIDDPVSSLDSQVLFVVNSLIHQLIARRSSESKPDKQNYFNPNIDQVFILTHNIFFFKEITLDNGRGCTLRQFYHITKINNVSYVTTKGEKEIGTSDYNLMWSSLKSIKDSNTATNEQNVLIGNLMRRIIESYVNFLGIGKSVWAAVNGVDPEDTRNIIFSSLISEVSDTSHKVSPLDDIYFTRIMNENPENLFDAFKDIFKEIGKEHYELMMNESIQEEMSN